MFLADFRDVPKAFAMAMLSRMAISGTEMVVLPSSLTTSTKLYVWFPLATENGGGPKGGKPSVIFPVILKGLMP